MSELDNRSVWAILNSDDLVAFEFVENLDATLLCGYENYEDCFIQETRTLRNEGLPIDLYTVGDSKVWDGSHKLPDVDTISFPNRILNNFYPIDEVEGNVQSEQTQPFFVNSEDESQDEVFIYPKTNHKKMIDEDVLTIIDLDTQKTQTRLVNKKAINNRNEVVVKEEYLDVNVDEIKKTTENNLIKQTVSEPHNTNTIETTKATKNSEQQIAQIQNTIYKEESLRNNVSNNDNKTRVIKIVENSTKEKIINDTIIEEQAIARAEKVFEKIVKTKNTNDIKKDEIADIVDKVSENKARNNALYNVNKEFKNGDDVVVALKYQNQVIGLQHMFEQKLNDLTIEMNKRMEEKMSATWNEFLRS